MTTTYLYVGSGTWGPKESGKISHFVFDRTEKSLHPSGQVDAGGLASFIAIDSTRHRLFCADEDDGGVLSFSLDPQTGNLTRKGARVGTHHPVYLILSADEKHLLAANYEEGSVELYPIGKDGVALPPSHCLESGAHAHCVVLRSSKEAIVANKSEHTLRRFQFETGALLHSASQPTSHTSPRHVAFAPNGDAYVVSEFADTLTRYRMDETGSLIRDFQAPRLPPGGEPQRDTGSDVVLTPDGNFLYAGNRGESNTIVAFDLRGEEPELLGHIASGGKTPRKLAMDPQGEFLAVGNRESNNISVFSIGADGRLSQSMEYETEVSPYFVLFVEF